MGQAGSRLLFLADSHLPRSSEAVAELIDYLEPHVRGSAGLYLLGDVFHYSVGLASFRTPAQDQLVNYLDGLARDGLRIGYIGGNRDYFLDEMLRGHDAIARTEGSLDIRPFGIPVHLVHGDCVNRADMQYLLWRRVSRSAPSRLLLSSLPDALARRLGDRLEGSMKTTNRRYRVDFPEEACRSYAAEAVRRGSQIVLMGHFHEPRSVALPGGGFLHVLPDWLSRRTHAELHADGTFVLQASR